MVGLILSVVLSKEAGSNLPEGCLPAGNSGLPATSLMSEILRWVFTKLLCLEELEGGRERMRMREEAREESSSFPVDPNMHRANFPFSQLTPFNKREMMFSK